VRVEGLETLDYFDNLVRIERFTKIAIKDYEKEVYLVLRKSDCPMQVRISELLFFYNTIFTTFFIDELQGFEILFDQLLGILG
jgi:hypothetical protein